MSDDFPILFTVGNSSRHDVVLISANLTISNISSKLEAAISASPNCRGALDKYSKNKNPHEVKSIKVRWANEPRESKLWPSATVLTKDNVEAVLRLVALHQGKDILEVEAEQKELSPEEKKGAERAEPEGEETK